MGSHSGLRKVFPDHAVTMNIRRCRRALVRQITSSSFRTEDQPRLLFATGALPGPLITRLSLLK